MDAFDYCRERKHRRPLTSGDASIVPLTLASGVVVCRLLLPRCRAFAACSPPAGLGCPLFVTISGRLASIIWMTKDATSGAGR
jgi:hypothetical protein